MSLVSASDIFKLGVIFYRLWEFAFSKAKNAGNLPTLCFQYRRCEWHVMLVPMIRETMLRERINRPGKHMRNKLSVSKMLLTRFKFSKRGNMPSLGPIYNFWPKTSKILET